MHSGLLFVLVFDVADARSSGSASECGVPFQPSPDVVDDVGKGRNGEDSSFWRRISGLSLLLVEQGRPVHRESKSLIEHTVNKRMDTMTGKRSKYVRENKNLEVGKSNKDKVAFRLLATNGKLQSDKTTAGDNPRVYPLYPRNHAPTIPNPSSKPGKAPQGPSGASIFGIPGRSRPIGAAGHVGRPETNSMLSPVGNPSFTRPSSFFPESLRRILRIPIHQKHHDSDFAPPTWRITRSTLNRIVVLGNAAPRRLYRQVVPPFVPGPWQ
ncbi:uncharacterized protein B0T23DRAFT_438954 [Neurospora hispaniola]|uniref:Secreted protein n=1 Tax=Neurospora hispaniola TaxID=588809 RepID=A0AAJ0IDV7_9PEZI|nr:hypothetical protein B0T23DRAFT_438954 [Neurospora hispaniola]